jgi:predicted amidohydrolase YtcJ
LAALLLAVPAAAHADVLIDNVDGRSIGADGTVQRFTGLLIDDQGRIEQILLRGERRPPRPDFRLDGKGRVLMPGLIVTQRGLMAQALARIAPAAPEARPRPEDRDQALIEVQKLLLERGVTTVADIGTTIEDWQAYRRAGDLGTLSVRIVAYAASVEDLVLIAGPRPTPWLYDGRLRGLGLRIDFALPPATRPPARPARPGEAVIPLKNLLSRAGIDGFQPAIVLRERGALPLALDAIGEIAQTYKGERRWRIELDAMPTAAELPRLAAAGAVLGLTPAGLQAAPSPTPEAPVGLPELAQAKVRFTFGAGGALAAPFDGVAAALRREEALAALGPGAAWAAFAEGTIGRITVGQRADLVLLDRDPLLASATELRALRVVQTWVGGKLVYQAKDEAAPSPAAPR